MLSFIVEIAVGVVITVALTQEVLLLLLFRPYRPGNAAGDFPFVSMLIAMRDEEDNVDRCLDHLRRQDYPADRYEILVGDDGSGDGTLEKLYRHQREDTRVKVFAIAGTIGVARGKANVLAHLTRHAKGSLYLITDADVAVNPSWCRNMAAGLKPGIGLVNGFTSVEGSTFQHMEWLQAQAMLHVLHRFTTVTAIGNNMMVTREACEAAGGFESIDFSVTEDFAMTRKVIGKGYRLQSRLCSGTHGRTLAQRGLGALMSQRKRWMQGAVRLPFGIVTLLLLRALYYPAVFLLLAIEPLTGIFVFVLRAFLQSALVWRVNRQADHGIDVLYLLGFEIYQCIMIWAEIIAYLIPGKVIWKGREFT